MLEGQFAAYDFIIDLATGEQPIAEAWLRALHEEICKGQETYTVRLPDGTTEERPLPKGKYKSEPNHVLTRDGRIHSYAPVDATASEMGRLCRELNSNEFQAAHPILQSSYAHYALVTVHPFTDGNGRVARALASVFTNRGASIPLLITLDNKTEYLDALEAADNGDYQELVGFTLQRAVDTVRLVESSFKAASAPLPAEERERLRSLFVTPSGFTLQEIDGAAANLFNDLHQAMIERQKDAGPPEFHGSDLTFQAPPSPYSPTTAGYRLSVSQGHVLVCGISASSPAGVKVTRTFAVEVPTAGSKSEEAVLVGIGHNLSLRVAIADLWPTVKSSVQMRLSLEAERITGEMFQELVTSTAAALARKGYR